MRFHSLVRSGLIALGVLAGLSTQVAASPLTGVSRTAVAPATADASSDIVNVNRRYRCYNGNCGTRYGRRHLQYNYWNDNDNWRYRKYHRPYRRHLHVRPRVYLGVPAYRYVQPRRHYGYRMSSAHVAWCYSRYLSYRQWDNTFQPYHGRRRQCWSPYS